MPISTAYFRSLICFVVLATFSSGFLTDNAPSLVERLASIEANISNLLSAVAQLQKKYLHHQAEIKALQGCTVDSCGVHWAAWSEWGRWSVCTGDCTNGHGSREQTRTRTRHCLNGDQSVSQSLCKGVSSQPDKRLCHAVEFYDLADIEERQKRTSKMDECGEGVISR